MMTNEYGGEDFSKELYAFVHQKIQSLGEKADFDDDTELVENMIISSLSLITLLAGIEEYVGRDIITDDFGIEDFTSVNKIMSSVQKVCRINYAT